MSGRFHRRNSFDSLGNNSIGLHDLRPDVAVLGHGEPGRSRGGAGATGIPSIAAAYSSVPKAKLGIATTAINIVQRLGGPIATTVIAITVSLSAVSHPISSRRAFLIPFVVLIALQLLALVSTSRLPVRIHANET